MARKLPLLMLAALAPAAASGAELTLPEPSLGRQQGDVLPLRLFSETLRIPFGEGWGGETFLYRPIRARLSVGLALRAWSEAICVRPSCEDRRVEGGVEVRYRVKPGFELGGGLSVQRSAGTPTGPAILPHVHLKF